MADGGYFNDVVLLWISRYDYNPGWQLLPHSHDEFYQLIYCISGEGCAHIDSWKGSFVPSSAMFIRPGEEHSIEEIGESGLKTLDIKFIINNPILADKLSIVPSFIPDCPDDIREKLELIRMEGEDQDYEYVQYGQLYLGQLLLDLLRMHLPVRKRDSKNIGFYYRENLSDISVRVLAYIENNYTERIAADDIAEALHYSYRYISRRTMEEIGRSPVELVDEYRCHMAKKYLVLSTLELKQISEAVGYPNVHHFSRTFRKIVGMPPARFRADSLQGIRKDLNFREWFVNEDRTRRTQ